MKEALTSTSHRTLLVRVERNKSKVLKQPKRSTEYPHNLYRTYELKYTVQSKKIIFSHRETGICIRTRKSLEQHPEMKKRKRKKEKKRGERECVCVWKGGREKETPELARYSKK